MLNILVSGFTSVSWSVLWTVSTRWDSSTETSSQTTSSLMAMVTSNSLTLVSAPASDGLTTPNTINTTSMVRKIFSREFQLKYFPSQVTVGRTPWTLAILILTLVAARVQPTPMVRSCWSDVRSGSTRVVSRTVWWGHPTTSRPRCWRGEATISRVTGGQWGSFSTRCWLVNLPSLPIIPPRLR